MDETSLNGTYDFVLSWMVDTTPSPPVEAPIPGPSLLTAVEEQLGLKLQARRVPATIQVVDSANRSPTENYAPPASGSPHTIRWCSATLRLLLRTRWALFPEGGGVTLRP